MKKYFAEQLLAQAPRLLEISPGADAIVGTARAWSAPSVGETLGIPALELLPTSLAPSSAITARLERMAAGRAVAVAGSA